MSEYKFKNDPKKIDEYIQAEDKGATFPFLSESMKLEMSIRRKQIIADINGFDEDEDDEYAELIETAEELTKGQQAAFKPIEVEDAEFRPLPKRIQQQLEEDMKVSIVRNDPESEYNKTDAELYGDKERREILQKLSRIRNIYYDPISYRAAILTIKEAIEYSLKHDYPWYQSQEEVLRDFNCGKIKYLGNIPKLYLGFGTNQVTDPQILAGIVSGEVQVIDKQSEEKELRKKKKKVPYTPVHVDYDVVWSNEYQHYSKLHNQGIDTPISVVLKSKSQLFDRLSIPFSFVPQEQEKKEDPRLENFNWFREGAGLEYFCIKNGIPMYNQSSLINAINKVNNNELNQTLSTNMQNFLNNYNHPQEVITGYVQPAKPFTQSDKALEIEQSILNAIRQNNPNL